MHDLAKWLALGVRHDTTPHLSGCQAVNCHQLGFPSFSPHIWNDLLPNVSSAESLSTFRQ